MKDFRGLVENRAPTPQEIADLLQNGQLSKALRKATAAGINLPQPDIDGAVERMYRSGRAGELLANVGIVLMQYDAATLLRRALEVRDYHGFLKHAYRLQRTDMVGEIESAISAVQQNAPNEAAGWRRKFFGDSGPRESVLAR
jgi:hypothetical protein